LTDSNDGSALRSLGAAATANRGHARHVPRCAPGV